MNAIDGTSARSVCRGRRFARPAADEGFMKATTINFRSVGLSFLLAGLLASTAFAQAPLPAPPPLPQTPASASLPLPPSYPPAELDRVVSPIALYPDPLLAQV